MLEDYDLTFPEWANEALFDDRKMEQLWQHIEDQTRHYHPRYNHLRPDGSYEEISPTQNQPLYEAVVADRVAGVIRAFFNPVTLNRYKVAMGQFSELRGRKLHK